jgi:hypothetical protein
MARMKELYSIIEELEALFPDGKVIIDLDSGNYYEIVIKIKTGFVAY